MKFKLINQYPGSKLSVGDIIESYKGETNPYMCSTTGMILEVTNPENYPNLFLQIKDDNPVRPLDNNLKKELIRIKYLCFNKNISCGYIAAEIDQLLQSLLTTDNEQPKCNKVEARICCEDCGYPLSEALYPDNFDNPLPCNASEREIRLHINDIQRLKATVINHPYDCKCLICR